MSKDEALKLALEALEEATTYTSSPSWSPSMTEECNKAITALREALAEQPAQQEPVTWADYEPDGMHHNKPAQQQPVRREQRMYMDEEVFYTTPAQQEPVAYIGMIDKDHFADVCHKANGNSNTPLYTSPPQRKPLTDEEILTVVRTIDEGHQYLPSALKQLARAIEAAHGIKENT